MVQPIYAVFCVPPGQEVVVMESVPPLDAAPTVTLAAAVVDPDASFAVKV